MTSMSGADNQITCPKIGAGTDSDPIRPDTDYLNWTVIEETETEFVIEILEV